jgi:hypothetical protein
MARDSVADTTPMFLSPPLVAGSVVPLGDRDIISAPRPRRGTALCIEENADPLQNAILYGGHFGRLQVASRAENGRSRFLAVTGMGSAGSSDVKKGGM